jgi:cation diffusion facilitator CzcD-associated flavoprotein CzcO
MKACQKPPLTVIAIKLQEAFGDDVEIAIFEKNADVGGTWLEN